MRITTKFVGSSALLIVLTAVFSGSGYVINRETGKSLDARYARAQATVSSAIDLSAGLHGQVSALSRLSVLTGSQEEIERYERSRQAFLNALDDLEKALPEEDSLSLLRLDAIRQQHRYLDPLAGGLLVEESQVESAPDPERIEDVTRSLRLYERQSNHYVRLLLETAQEQMEDYSQQQQVARRQTAWLETLSFSLVIVLLAAQYYGLLKPVLRSLHQLQSGAQAIGKQAQSTQQMGLDGLALESWAATPKINLNTQDELQAVANAFNQMGDHLSTSYYELESKVAERTASLNHANETLLEEVRDRKEAEKELSQVISQLKQTQLQLLQTEKLSSLNQLVAGVAHEINNPVSFIQGNLDPAQSYMDSLLNLVASYQAEYPEASDELQAAVEHADLEFVSADFPQLLASIKTGVERITTIVRSLQTFSHMDESETKTVDLHQGLDSVLLILAAKLNATAEQGAISVVRKYGNLPKVYCYPSQLNQVFMSLLTNAVDALNAVEVKATEVNAIENSDSNRLKPTITITTAVDTDCVRIVIADNGIGMTEETRCQIFDPFFTTKPVGAGTGLGLSMSYQIVTGNHQGQLTCESTLGVGTKFTVAIPLMLKTERKLPLTVSKSSPSKSLLSKSASDAGYATL
ncbi:MAG: ATP-binding protein [Cyanobacteria bacterium P01_C01_bin.121]